MSADFLNVFENGRSSELYRRGVQLNMHNEIETYRYSNASTIRWPSLSLETQKNCGTNMHPHLALFVWISWAVLQAEIPPSTRLYLSSMEVYSVDGIPLTEG